MAKTIELPHNWRPRHYQVNAWNALVNDGIKRLCLVWHRRAGKDDLALHATAVMMHKRPAVYWHMLPQAEQARKAIWEAVNPHTGIRRIDEAFPKELRAATRENEMSITFKNGAVWRIVGSDNYDSLVGSPPAGVVFSEWALADPHSWGFIRPILAENDGWAMFIYTPRGPNHGLKTFELAQNSPNWYCERLTVDDTGVFTKQQLELEREELIEQYGKEQGEAFFQQEYYCSFDAAVIGSIYGAHLERAREEGRITNLAIDPYKPVGTMWDLGFTDSTAIWFFQQNGDFIDFVDYFEASGETLKFYARVLKGKAEKHGWEYGRRLMLFPHDVRNTESGSGKSRVRMLNELGVHVIAPRKPVPIWDGIEYVRRNFHRFRFDVSRCARGLEMLALYRRKWDPKNKIYSSKPVHDESSHAADALRIGVWQLPKDAFGLEETERLISPKRTPKDRYRRALENDGDILLKGPPTFWAA